MKHLIIISFALLAACDSEGTQRIKDSREAEAAICACDTTDCALEALGSAKKRPGVWDTKGVSQGEAEQIEASLQRTLACVKGIEKL